MLNSISLSSDMKTLYLIDNGRAISYDLEAGNGVLIGALGEQLVVASALTPVENVPTTGGSAANSRATANKISLPTKAGNQWTLTYTRSTRTLSVIGITDIDIGLRTSGSSNDCDSHLLGLGKSIVHMAKKNDVIEITPLDLQA